MLNILPGVTLLGFGLAMTVAPLTGTVLAAAPVIVGLSGSEYADPASLAPAYRAALLTCAGIMAAGSALTDLGLPRARENPAAATV